MATSELDLNAVEAVGSTAKTRSAFRMGTIARRFWFRRLASPISRLPVELLEIIFIYYAHEAETQSDEDPLPHTGLSTFSSQTPDLVNPMVLGEVSRQWRQISRSLAPLWSKIYISHPTMEHVELATYWLSLAGNSPLTLGVSAPLPTKEGITAMGRLSDLFISNYDTWHIIDFDPSYFYPLFLRIPNHAPPILRSARLEIGLSYTPDSRVVRAVDTLYSSSTLQRVVWGSSHYNIPEALEKFPNWTTLRHFVDHQSFSHNSLTIHDLLLILNACPVLESLDAIIFPPDRRGSLLSISSPLIHHYLRSLTAATSPELLSELFKTLILPALEELTIRHFYFSIPSHSLKAAAPILDLLERSSCTLRAFALITPSTPEEVVLSLIAAPQLQHVRRIQLAGIKTERTLDLLTRKRGDPQSLAILPLLERLTFYSRPDFISALHASLGAIKHMILSRRDKSLLSSIDSNNTMSLLAYANLGLPNLDFWDYSQLNRLGSAHFKIIPSRNDRVPILRHGIANLIRDRYLQVRETITER